MNFNGLPVYQLFMKGRPSPAMYVPLPREAWVATNTPCHCGLCKGQDSFYDTMVVPTESVNGPGWTWMTHAPELQFHPFESDGFKRLAPLFS